MTTEKLQVRKCSPLPREITSHEQGVLRAARDPVDPAGIHGLLVDLMEAAVLEGPGLEDSGEITSYQVVRGADGNDFDRGAARLVRSRRRGGTTAEQVPGRPGGRRGAGPASPGLNPVGSLSAEYDSVRVSSDADAPALDAHGGTLGFARNLRYKRHWSFLGRFRGPSGVARCVGADRGRRGS